MTMAEPENEAVARKICVSRAFVEELISATAATKRTIAPDSRSAQAPASIDLLLREARLRALPLAQLPPRIQRMVLFRPAFIARFTLRVYNYLSKPQREQLALLCDCVEALENRLRTVERSRDFEE